MPGKLLRNLLAMFLIIIGITLFLINIDIIDLDIKGVWHFIYPVFFIIIGLKWMIGYIMTRRDSWIFGSFFIIFGSLLLLGRFDVIDFYFGDIYKLWPLLIVYIGFTIIGGKKHPKIIVIRNKDKNKKENKREYHSFSIGEHEFNTMNWKVTPMELKNAVGDYFIDFSKAFIPEEEIPITISSWAGDIRILMPENVEFRVVASVLAGDINIIGETSEGINRNLFYETENYETATQKLDLYLKMSAGSIRIDKV